MALAHACSCRPITNPLLCYIEKFLSQIPFHAEPRSTDGSNLAPCQMDTGVAEGMGNSPAQEPARTEGSSAQTRCEPHGALLGRERRYRASCAGHQRQRGFHLCRLPMGTRHHSHHDAAPGESVRNLRITRVHSVTGQGSPPSASWSWCPVRLFRQGRAKGLRGFSAEYPGRFSIVSARFPSRSDRPAVHTFKSLAFAMPL
jgi:hypothetical protein